jgi:hypothetical protein
MVLKRAGMPSGSVCCVLRVPSLDLHDTRSFAYPHGHSRLRRFLQERVPAAEDAREGATFMVTAEVRHRENQGYRRIVLCRWRAGESVNQALEQVMAGWRKLEEQRESLKRVYGPDVSDMRLMERIEQACRTLSDEEARAVRTQLKTVGRQGIKSFGHLLLAVRDTKYDSAFRIIVCSLLQVLVDPEAAIALARTLADAADNDALVWAAANALAALRIESAIPILMQVLEEGTLEQQAAAAWVMRL